MKGLKKINAFRRSMMRALTRHVGSVESSEEPIQKEKIKQILVCRPNHRLGNQLLITPLIQELAATFPDSKIDVFVKGGVANVLFERYGCIDKIIQLPKDHFKKLLPYLGTWWRLKQKKYDLVINVDKDSSSGRLSTKWARGRYKFFGDDVEDLSVKYNDSAHIAKYPVYRVRDFFSLLGIPDTHAPVPVLDLKLTAEELEKGKVLLSQSVDSEKPVISVFTYATGTKCYSESWWDYFYIKLKESFPDYSIVEILPVENISQIGFKAPSFYSKDVREIASVVAATRLFIGADSGIMHLASASKTPTIGLFSVSSLQKYQPYGNGSMGVHTGEQSAEEIVSCIKKILAG